MKTINTYSFTELSQESKEYAINQYRNNNTEVFWIDEIINSLKGLFDNINGVKLKEYSLGDYHRNYVRLNFDQEGVRELSGKRAFVWFENNFFSNLRINFYSQERKELRQYGKLYYPDNIKSCPFTGFYFDDVLIDAIKKGLIKGESIEDILHGLADVVEHEIEGEEECQDSDEYISEILISNDYQFLENGKRI